MNEKDFLFSIFFFFSISCNWILFSFVLCGFNVGGKFGKKNVILFKIITVHLLKFKMKRAWVIYINI